MSTAPRPTLPNPGSCENGQAPCNEPLTIDGKLVGYCSALNGHSVRYWRNNPQRRPLKPHDGPHRIEWWT